MVYHKFNFYSITWNALRKIALLLFSQQLWKSASGLMVTALITVWLVSFWQHWCNKLFIFCMLNVLSLQLPEFSYWCTKCKRQGLHLIKVICVRLIFSKHSEWNHISSLPKVSSETVCARFSNRSYFSSPTIYSKTCVFSNRRARL